MVNWVASWLLRSFTRNIDTDCLTPSKHSRKSGYALYLFEWNKYRASEFICEMTLEKTYMQHWLDNMLSLPNAWFKFSKVSSVDIWVSQLSMELTFWELVVLATLPSARFPLCGASRRCLRATCCADCIYVCVYAYVYVYKYSQIHVYNRLDIYIYIHICIFTYMSTYIYTYISRYIHKYIYIFIYTYI